MVRTLVLMLVLVGCGGGQRVGEPGGPSKRHALGDRLLDLTERMCACKDRACALAVEAEMAAWRVEAAHVDVHPELRTLAGPAYEACKDRQTDLAVAIVMHGAEYWIGNDSEVPQIDVDAPDRWLGAFVDLREAVKRMDLAGLGPRAKGMLIAYADKPMVRMPLGPIAKLPAAFGTQRDYFGTTGSELVSGVQRALAELHQVEARRVLIIVGDGSDTNPEGARTELAALKRQAAEDKVEVHAFVYRAKLSSGPVVVDVLAEHTTRVHTVDKMAAGIEQVLQRLKAR